MGKSLVNVKKLNDFASVKDFGAVGDGVTDDTAAFLSAAATGKSIAIPEGSYVLSSTIAFSSQQSVIGLGSMRNTIIYYSGSGFCFSWEGSGVEGGTPKTRFQLKNIYINGNTNTLSDGGISISRCYIVRIEDCGSVNFGKSGANPLKLRNNFNVEVVGGNYATGAVNPGSGPVVTLGSEAPSDWNSSNIQFRNTLLQRGTYGCKIEHSANQLDNVLFDNVSFGLNSSGSFYSNQPNISNIIFRNNHFEGVGYNGSSTLVAAKHIYVENAVCVDLSSTNSFQDCFGEHIHLKNVNSYVIQNQKIFETGGLTVGASTAIKIEGASCKGFVGRNNINTTQIDTLHSIDSTSYTDRGIQEWDESAWSSIISANPSQYRSMIVNRVGLSSPSSTLANYQRLTITPDGSTLLKFMMTPNNVFWVSDMPSSGSFTAGDIAFNTGGGVDGIVEGQYTILGWRRLTTGSGNVLNTDWIELRCLTGT